MNQEDKKSTVLNFRKELETFSSKVSELHRNSGLHIQEEFLKQMADDINRLYASSIQVQKAEDEDIEEIGSLVQNLFVQPIATKHHKHVTILKAVETFEPGKGDECDLSFILREYVNHPASTKSFLMELSLLTEDLDEALKKIA